MMDPNQALKAENKNLSSTERKQKERDKKKALAAGHFKQTPIEEAKATLSSMESPDLNTLLLGERFKNSLDPDAIASLRNYIYYLRAKKKKEQELAAIKNLEKQVIHEKTLRFCTDEVQELRTLFSGHQTAIEKAGLIEAKINENLFSFLSYMETLQSADPEFLKIIVHLKEKLPSSSYTKLFVRVCGLYKGEDIPVTADVVQQAIAFLNEEPKENRAITGLLRLAFRNSISFIAFSKDLLIQFNELNEHLILQFFRTLTDVKSQVLESLPGTVFFFTTPMIEALKVGGQELHHSIPPQYLPYIIEIVCYSFTDRSSDFKQFLIVFKNGCHLLYERLLDSNFALLLHALLEQTKQMNPGYFQNLAGTTNILERSFRLIQEKRITRFNQELVDKIMNADDEAFMVMNERPKVLRMQTKDQFSKAFTPILKDFPELIEFQEMIQRDLSENQKAITSAMSIQELLPLQHVVFKLWSEGIQEGKWLIQYPTGQGKTALCLGLAAIKAKNGVKVLILNESKDLTFRDFKKAQAVSSTLELSVSYCESAQEFSVTVIGIIFMTVECFMEISPSVVDHGVEGYCLIIDEFDSLLSNNLEKLHTRCQILLKFNYSIGFTGSHLQQFHIQFIETAVSFRVVKSDPRNMNLQSIDLRSQEIISNLAEYRKQIQITCSTQTLKTPIILIADEHQERIMSCLQAAKVPFENLSLKNPSEVDSVMGLFTAKQCNRYSVYIIRGEQGRGIDFPSDSYIEAAGGVYLLIATLPTTFLQYQQFLGRTGRIGNKGQYSILLFDRMSKNCAGSIYLNKHLNQLQNADILTISKISSKHGDKENVSIVNDKIHESSLEPADDASVIKDQQDTPLLQKEDSFLKKRAITDLQKQEEEEKCFQESKDTETSHACGRIPDNSETSNKRETKLQSKEKNINRKEERRREILIAETDKAYFEGYAHKDIHIEMLSDEARMTAYRDGLTLVAPGKVVLDVGAGTGALALMAMEAGALKVYGIENSDIIQQAKKQVKFMGMEGKIILIKGRAEFIKPLTEKVDVLVSEWMGYFLLMEGMLSSVLVARDKWLKDDGVIIPSKASIFIAGITSMQDPNSLLLAIVDTNTYRNAKVEVCRSQNIITSSAEVFSFNLRTDNLETNGFDTSFEIVVLQNEMLTGFVGWFTTDMAGGIIFSTSPLSQATHWKQTVFTLEKFINVQSGDIIEGHIKVEPLLHNHRGLQITIFYSKKTQGFENKVVYWLEC